MLPNFIIVGAPKSGTTSLYHYLSEHPQIFMSSIKEPNYFSDNLRKMNQIEYENIFAKAKNEKAIGEASANYFWHDKAYLNIKEQIPNCKIIIMLRDPATRLYSAWNFGKRFGKYFGSIEAMISKREKYLLDTTSKNHPFYNGRGSYYYSVNKYIKLFGVENVFVGLFEDLLNSPIQLIQTIYSFLDVNNSYRPDIREIYNVGGRPKNSTIPRIIRLIGSVFKPVLLKFFNYDKLISYRNKILFIDFNKSSKSKSLSSTMRKRIHKIYYSDIVKLQSLLNRDLSQWLE